MSHKLRTSYRDSNLTYGRYIILEEFKTFMVGLCQGNGCATQLWSIINSIVFSALRTQWFGIHFINYFTTEIAQLIGFRYVDKCDMIQSDDDIESTKSQMKLTISGWEYLIIFTGGCLAPDKSVWYLVDYKWIWSKWKCTKPGQNKILEATNKTREISPLCYL